MKYLPIVRHVKVKMDTTIYDPAYKKYFEKREPTQKKLITCVLRFELCAEKPAYTILRGVAIAAYLILHLLGIRRD